MTIGKTYNIPRLELAGSPYEVRPQCLHCPPSHSAGANGISIPLISPPRAKSGRWCRHTQIGLQHGQQLAPQILDQLSIYRALFQEACKFEWAHVRTVAEAFRGSIARLAPDLLDEMRGIADGAAVGGEAWKDEGRTVDILDIVAMNARSEIALGQWDDGCTAIAWRFPENASGGPKQILAQNWDWREAVGKNLAMASIAREGKPKIWMVIEVRVAGNTGQS